MAKAGPKTPGAEKIGKAHLVAKTVAEVRRAEALRLRLQGYGYAEIGQKTSVSTTQAFLDVTTALKQFRQEASDTAIEVRQLELDRLDRAMVVISEMLDREVARKGENLVELKLRAIDRLVRVQERRARLLGLDAPAKQELSGGVEVIASPTEAARLVREAFGAQTAQTEPSSGNEPGDG